MIAAKRSTVDDDDDFVDTSNRSMSLDEAEGRVILPDSAVLGGGPGGQVRLVLFFDYLGSQNSRLPF